MNQVMKESIDAIIRDLHWLSLQPMRQDAFEIYALIASGELVIDRQASTPEAFARACEIMGCAE